MPKNKCFVWVYIKRSCLFIYFVYCSTTATCKESPEHLKEGNTYEKYTTAMSIAINASDISGPNFAIPVLTHHSTGT